MSGLRGFAAGVLMLAGLQALVSTERSAGRVGEFFTGANTVLLHVLDPTRPAIPDLRDQPRRRGRTASAQPAVYRGSTAPPAPAVSDSTFRRPTVATVA